MPLEDDDAPEAAAPPPKKRSKLPLMLIGLVLVGGVGFGGWYFGHKAVSGTDEPAPIPPPVYHRLEPAFVANVNDNGTLRYLQVEVQVMARDPKVFQKVTAMDPAIRDTLLSLFAGYPYPDLVSVEGRERLRADTLERLRTVIADEAVASQIEAVYFTSFVMQ